MNELIFVLSLLWTVVGFLVFAIVADAMTADKPNFKFFVFSLICGPVAWLFVFVGLVFVAREWLDDPRGDVRQWAQKIAKVIEE